MAVPDLLRYSFIWILPVVSALTWLGMLLAMFVVWEVEGSPHYASMSANQRIAYISDVGAQGLKPLFIAGCCVTTVFLDLSFAAERYLRHTGRLARNLYMTEKVLSVLSIIFAVAGTAGLILLSIFDTLRHPHLHDGFLLLFIAGYLISAIFICAEYQRLGRHFRQHRILRISFWVKLVFIILEVILAVVFGVSTFHGRQNVAAVFEWLIALIFTFYILTFLVDLLPVSRRSHQPRYAEQDTNNQHMNNMSMHDHHASNMQSTHTPYANGTSSASHTSHGIAGPDASKQGHSAYPAQNF